MTIKERAKAKYPTAYDYDTPAEVVAEKDAYISGATEQREIDIQQAVKWIDRLLERSKFAYWSESSRKRQINEFIKVMKVEEK